MTPASDDEVKRDAVKRREKNKLVIWPKSLLLLSATIESEICAFFSASLIHFNVN